MSLNCAALHNLNSAGPLAYGEGEGIRKDRIYYRLRIDKPGDFLSGLRDAALILKLNDPRFTCKGSDSSRGILQIQDQGVAVRGRIAVQKGRIAVQHALLGF